MATGILHLETVEEDSLNGRGELECWMGSVGSQPPEMLTSDPNDPLIELSKGVNVPGESWKFVRITGYQKREQKRYLSTVVEDTVCCGEVTWRQSHLRIGSMCSRSSSKLSGFIRRSVEKSPSNSPRAYREVGRSRKIKICRRHGVARIREFREFPIDEIVSCKGSSKRWLRCL